MNEAVLTRVVRVRASHRYGRSDWDAARNARVFGAAGSEHEHDYVFEVSWRGPVDPDRGFLLDLSEADRLLEERLVSPLRGRSVNDVIPRFGAGGLQPSTEELARWAWEEVEGQISSRASLVRVRVRESDTLWADYHGPDESAEGV